MIAQELRGLLQREPVEPQGPIDPDNEYRVTK
jgi:hypothetical protein